MSKMQCAVCEYQYDESVGDESQNISPGTPFEKLPLEFLCPDCGVGLEFFEPVKDFR